MEGELICAQCGLPIIWEVDGEEGVCFYHINTNDQPIHVDHCFDSFEAAFRANGSVIGGFEDLDELDRK